MRTIIISEGQNLVDVAIRYYGETSGLFALLADNPDLNLNSALAAGQKLMIDESKAINSQVIRYFDTQGKQINTGNTSKPEGIGYWFISLENIVQ
jgi:hypothetical protein